MLRKLVSLVLALMLVTACCGALADAAVYTALYGSEVSTLNYLTTSTTWDQTVGANVIDSLVEYNSYAQIIPGLAESWENSDDGLTWTFHLRQGQKWYDNACNPVADVTANDFVSAMKYILNPEYESNLVSNVSMIKNADAYYNALVDAAAEKIAFEEVGVSAVDDYTLVYTLEEPVPYFLSALTYTCFLPAYGPQLEALGAEFGTAADKMYYNGAFILVDFLPQEGHVYVKNENNWDAEHIYIDEIDRQYNSESANTAPTMALRGEVSSASLSNDVVPDWLENHPEMVSRERAMPDYSYFYCFNFDPKYGEEYNPSNWAKAVNNANFRHSIMSAFNRIYSMVAMEPNAEECANIIQNTITPASFCADSNGTDFSRLDAFAGIDEFYFNEEKALAYKAAALAELTDVTFPVTMVVTYKSSDSDWENESILLKQQLETVLGTDYINIELYAGPSDSFLSATRRSGMYSFMRCNWGADYADPQTWTDPFDTGNNYNFMDKMLDNEAYPETDAFLKEYYAAVAEAKASVTDLVDRYARFAKAEAMLIENAMVVPYYISPASYQVTQLNIFEGEYAPFGISNLRYKYQKLSDHFITPEEYEEAYAAWQDGLNNK